MAERFELARTVMRRRTGLDTNQAWRRLLKEHQNIAALKLATEDDIALRIDTMNLRDRLRDIETDCRDRLHVGSSEWGASTAPTSVALARRWRSRPQHQEQTCHETG